MKLTLALALILMAVTTSASAQGAATDTDESRAWRNAVQREGGNALLDFIERYLGSPHVAEARALLPQRRLQPLGRLVSGGQCAALLDERAEGLVQGYRKAPRFAAYDFNVPKGYFAGHSELEFRPRDLAPDQVPIEKVEALDLIADRDGGCTLYMRWSYGTGLPDECHCVPVDPAYVFQSQLANQVLADYARMKGASAACAAQGVDHTASVDAFLDTWLSAKERWVQVIRDKQQRKQTVYPSEAGEADDIAFALGQVRTRAIRQDLFDAARQDVDARPPQERDAYCHAGLPEAIENATMQTLLSTELIK